MATDADKKFTILHTEWSEGWGGQELRILAEMTAHRKRGHRLFLLCPPETRLRREAEAAGIPVIPLKIRGPWDLSAARRIRDAVRERRVEILHTHSSVDSWAGALAARWAGTPALIRTRHISVPVKRPFFNRLYYFPDAIITTGEHIRRDLLRSHRLPPDRVTSIPTGVNVRRFRPRNPAEALKKELGLEPEDRVLTLAAVLRTQKRHEIVVAALRAIKERFPRIRVLFVGEGPGRERIERAIAGAGLEPYFRLPGHREDIPEILSFTDAAVIPSAAEGVPQFLLQAMAAGRPVIATGVGGIPEVITSGENGILIPPEDPRSLAEAVRLVLDRPEKAREMGSRAREAVEREFTLERMAERVEQVYRRTLARRRRGTRRG